MLFSVINLPNMNLGQLQIVLALAGLISVFAVVSCICFLSARSKDSLTVLLISMVILMLPVFAYGVLGDTWIGGILPSAGIGMKNNFLYQLCDFHFLHIGGMSFWTPYVILLSAAVEISHMPRYRPVPIFSCAAFHEGAGTMLLFTAWEAAHT